MTAETIGDFVSALQKNCLPGVWSKGVAMSRDCPILEDSRTDDEVILRIQIPGRPVSPKVTLWPEEEDWYCDCGDRNDPCIHIAAAAIALKAGLTRKETPQSDNRTRLEYRFTRKDGALAFERQVIQPDGTAQILSDSLVSWIGGIQSGRLQAPVIPATKEDFAIDGVLGNRKCGIPERAVMEKLLPLLQGFTNVTLDGSSITTETQIVKLSAMILDEADGVRVRVALPEAVSETFTNGAAIINGKLRPLVASGLSGSEKEAFSGNGALLQERDFHKFVSEILPSLQERISVENRSKRLPILVEIEPRLVLRVHSLDDNSISVRPIVTYGSPAIAEVHGNSLTTAKGSQQTPLRKRDQEQRLFREAIAELQISPDQNTRFTGSQAIEFLARSSRWEKDGDAASRASRGELSAVFALSESGQPSLSFSLPNGEQANPEDVLRAWQAREGFVRLLDGSWAKLPRDWLNKYGETILQLLEARGGTGKLPGYFVPDALHLAEEMGQSPPAVFDSIRRALETFSGIPEAEIPADLKAELRSYQKLGVNWLSFLGKNGMGALLADDMGLGKTLQTLCAVKGKTLIVAPTSVMHSWVAQIKQFRPGLRFQLYHGPNRELSRDVDVTITSYAILRLDREILACETWETAVLDEAQTIRNPESQIARSAHSINAKTRIALTGTPIENRLDDLWSQFQFLNPGLLGTREEFQSRYSDTTTQAESLHKLKERIRPFVLRRLKKEVAPELPPRTESVIYCDLKNDERSLYDSVLAASRQEALTLLESGGSTFTILETLLRLRQTCCHSALLPGQTSQSSSKLELLLENLETTTAEGHRALVFSQWTSFLDLIEPALRSKGIAYLRLDGATPNRADIVDKFQSNSGPPVLLISLKAGGVGLTLTAADHVFLMDPWWNPAVENQAADRAHRIGQEKPVMIYRLAARDTIEDRILELQQRKLRLAGSVLEGKSGELGPLELTRDDLFALLQ